LLFRLNNGKILLWLSCKASHQLSISSLQYSSLALLQSFPPTFNFKFATFFFGSPAKLPTNFQFQVCHLPPRNLPPLMIPPMSTISDHLNMAILGSFRIDSVAQSLTKVSIRTLGFHHWVVFAVHLGGNRLL
jgi:hypothetical protein